MKGHGAKFGRKMEEAIAALLTQRNIEESAKAVGISPSTLITWMKQPECPGRGRDIGRPIPPAQIPTGGITA